MAGWASTGIDTTTTNQFASTLKPVFVLVLLLRIRGRTEQKATLALVSISLSLYLYLEASLLQTPSCFTVKQLVAAYAYLNDSINEWAF